MKNLIIIGAGGMGRTMYDLCKESVGYNTEYTIKGFIDDDLTALNNFIGYPSIIDTVKNYIPLTDDVFVCSIGGQFRVQCIQNILDKGGIFLNLIHNTARIGSNVVMGNGNIVGAYTTIAADSKIGNFNFIQSYTIIGHDVVIGNWNRIDSHVMCVGGISIGNNNNIHTSAMLNHGIKVGNYTRIGACSLITKNVDDEVTMFSNSARRLI